MDIKQIFKSEQARHAKKREIRLEALTRAEQLEYVFLSGETVASRARQRELEQTADARLGRKRGPRHRKDPHPPKH